MEIKNYNQYNSYYTKNACTIVSLLNILKYRYAIFVIPNYIIRMAIYFDKLWVFSISKWASFSIIDRAFIYYLNKKLWLNFSLTVNQISNLGKNDHDTYQMWIKGYSTRKYNKIRQDWIITRKDIDYLTTWSWGVWHAVNWDWSAWGYLVDTDWSKNTRMSLDVLRYGLSKDLFWDNIRTIDCKKGSETEEVTNLTIKMFQAEKKGKLNLLYNKESENPYLSKAKFLYFYGR